MAEEMPDSSNWECTVCDKGDVYASDDWGDETAKCEACGQRWRIEWDCEYVGQDFDPKPSWQAVEALAT